MANQIAFYPSEFNRQFRMAGGPVGRRVNLLARAIAAEAGANTRARLQQRTGRLAGGYRVIVQPDPINGFAFYVTNSTTGINPQRKRSYAQAQEIGSMPHIILPRGSSIGPKRGKAAKQEQRYLRFMVTDRMGNQHYVVTPMVNHPGTRGRHMLRDAGRLVSARFMNEVNSTTLP